MTVQLIIDSKFNRQGLQQAEQEIRGLVGNLDKIFKTASSGALSPLQGLSAEKLLGGNFEGRIKQTIASLDQYKMRLRETAAAALGVGDAHKAIQLLDAADQVERLSTRFGTLTEEQEKSGNVVDFINNKFNKFAFGLFVVTGAINTVTRGIRQMTEFLIEGASQADRLATFNTLMSEGGQNANQLAADLRTAAQGAVTLDTAIRPTLQLLKAGLPEAAAQTDALLQIATNAAILSGDLAEADTIYTKLVRGIVRGSPRLIDDADIILKLGDAYERYAEKMGIVGRELDANEQKLATLDAVLREGTRINDLAEDVDSAALALQQLKVDAEEAGQAIKRTLARGISETIQALDDFADMFDGIIIKFAEFITGSEEVAMMFEQALDARPIQTFVRGILTTFDVLGAHIRGRAAEIIEVWNALVSAIVSGAVTIQAAFDRLRGEITTDEALQRINEQAEIFEQRVKDAANPTNQLSQELEAVRQRARDAGEELGFYASETEAAAAASENLVNTGLSNRFNELSAGIQAAIEARTGLSAQFAEKRADIEEDLRDRIIDINENLTERVAEINENLRDKLVSIGEKYREDVTKVAEDTAEKLADIDEQLAEKLDDATEEAAEARSEAKKQQDKGIEDAHERHQKKLLDIERKFEASRLKALIDRDARALFEAQQARAEGRDEAEDDLNDAIEEEQEQLQERLEKINELEEERRKDAIEAAEERRKDALKAQAERLQDLEDSFKKQKAAARKAALEQKQDAIRDAQERRQDAQKAQMEALRDLDEWYRDQLLAQKEANLQRKINELEHLDEMGELTQAHLDELRGMWDDYNSFVAGETGATPTGGATPPSGGGGGGGSGGNGGTIGGAQPGGGNSGTLTPIFPGGSGHTFGQMNLNITSNDKMLEDVLKSTTYDAVLQTVGE